MNLTNRTTIKAIAEKYSITPKKFASQHFLVDPRALQKMVDAAELSKKDTVLEIGPGLGVLTHELAKSAGRIIAIEKDARMIEVLKGTLEDFKNVTVIHGDILERATSVVASDFGLEEISGNRPPGRAAQYKLVANLPYAITSKVLEKFLSAEVQPEKIVLMLQKEVVERIVAKPDEMSFLSVFVQFFGMSRLVAVVPSQSFYPAPKVDSAILEISNIAHRGSPEKEKIFFDLVGRAFRAPRKKIKHTLSRIQLERAAIDEATRPGAVTWQQWLDLFSTI